MGTILKLNELPGGGDLEGYRYGDVESTFVWGRMERGTGPKQQRPPYAEILIVLHGPATYPAGDETIEAEGGQVLIGPPNTPHTFVISGTVILRRVEIRCTDRFVTEWLED